jgi:hypothetical protein
MESDLDFADVHHDYQYIEALCGECGALWPIQRSKKAMAHHLRATLAAQRLYNSLTLEALNRASDLLADATCVWDGRRCLAYRWERRRAITSARQLSIFLAEPHADALSVSRPSYTRRSF